MSIPPPQRAINPVSMMLVLFAVALSAATASWIVAQRMRQETQESPPPKLTPPKFVVVAQEQQDTSFPVMLQTRSLQYQKVAQTFTPPEPNMRLSAIAPFVDYVQGQSVHLRIVRARDRKHPWEGKVLRRIKLDPFDMSRGYYEIPLDPPVPMQMGQEYSFVVEVREIESQVSIGLIHATNAYAEGRAWYYARMTVAGGNLITLRHKWYSPGDDLAFRLTFVRD